VLIPLVIDETGVSVLMTRRALGLRSHPGQYSFPGGKAEAQDADRTATALRETEEEIGLARDRIEIIGTMPPYRARSGYDVTPVVGVVRGPLELKLDPAEVESVMRVPLERILKPRAMKIARKEFRGTHARFYTMSHEGREVWGISAGILEGFRKIALGVTGTPAQPPAPPRPKNP
jgi:8-oxo-dGTP pyrophosphatase MutT (NUDIX family)